MKKYGKIFLFISSYLPVWLVWILFSTYSLYTQGFHLNTQGANFVAMLFGGTALTIISLITGYQFNDTYQTASVENKKTIYISDISYKSSDAISYLLTLILPIGTSTLQLFGGTLDLNGLVTLFLIFGIFFIYIHSNLVVMNPTMMFFGYSLYAINYKITEKSEITFNAALISKKPIDEDDITSMNTLIVVDQGIYLVRR